MKMIMLYDFKKQLDAERAKIYLQMLIEKQAKTELTEKHPKRTLDQNALFHVWIGVFAEHIGDVDLEKCKSDVKNHLLGIKVATNQFTKRQYDREWHTSQMDKQQMSAFMDKFKVWAQTEFGCYLPYFGDVGYKEMIGAQ